MTNVTTTNLPTTTVTTTNLKRLIFVLITTLSTTACLNSTTGKPTMAATNPSPTQLSTFDANIYPLNKVVCDPFDPSNPGSNDGLAAILYYSPTQLNSVQEYIDHGTRSNKFLFFSTLNVPTRLFNLGFPTETGSLVKNDQGADLVENFALSFSSVLKLGPNDEEGTYELALLSDDGAVFKVKQSDGTYKTVVDNDGLHPTRMGCGSETITMTKDTELLVQLNYYQGPRYHISLIPLWRKVKAENVAESACGLTSNDAFFDYNHNSAPQAAYTQILARGWKPISAENWNLPGSSVFNPCMTGEPPVISEFKLVRSEEGFVTLSWKTDIPATSQIYYKNVASGLEGLTPADNVMRTSHQVSLFAGMVIGQTYDFQAISISEDFGKSLSSLLRITVQ